MTDALPEGHPLPWSELVEYEQQQGGYWLYGPHCDVYGNGKIWVGVPRPQEAEAAATLARERADHAAVILWCADRVRSVDDGEGVQDAADYLHDLSTRAQADTATVTDRAAIIRWCAELIHSMGGDADVERAAEYLDDLATEAEGAA